MTQPPELADDMQRLRALAAYGLADTAPTTEFNRFAAMAADLLGLPIGLVSLVGADHVSVIGRAGIEADRIPREHAFCSYAILDDAVMVAPDLTQDRRFADNPLVTGAPALRFYAGAPLISPANGQRIGTVCVASPTDRPLLSDRETRLLANLAALTMDRMELRRAENARRGSEARFERMAAASPDAVVCADRNEAITYWNPAAERSLNWTAAEAMGRPLAMAIPQSSRAKWREQLAALTSDPARGGRSVELAVLRRDGGTFPSQVTLSSWEDDGAPAIGVIIKDITARQRANEQLQHLAHHDSLTGCASRAWLTAEIDAAAAAGSMASIALIDLDGFKRVNDTAGHAAGDAFLMETARRLAAALAGRGALVRLGGDEFAAFLPDCDDADAARQVARDMQASVKPPFRTGGREFAIEASAGIAAAGAPADVGSLLASAGLALHQAKTAGTGQSRVFDSRIRDRYIAQRNLEEEVARAALGGEFELFYQPQVSLEHKTVVGAEALIRWRHPRRGLLAPGAFLAALESGPLAGAVGDWTVIEACRQAAKWRRQGFEFRVAVNLFAEQLRAGDLKAKVLDALSRYGLPHSALELELTERIALRQDQGLLDPLHALHERGVSIAFDDFGTGFASLSTLKRCPLDRLKIDRSFVLGLGAAAGEGGASRGDVAIVEAVLALARGLGVGVVAEGVETEAQAAFLAERGCGEAQGYLYGRPVPASEIA